MVKTKENNSVVDENGAFYCTPSDLSVSYCESLFEGCPMGVVLISIEGKLIKVNSALCNILDFSEGELLNKDFNSFTHPKDIEPSEQMFKTLRKRSHSYVSIVKRFITKTGKIVWCEVRLMGIYNSSNNKLNFCIEWISPLPNGGNYKVEKTIGNGHTSVEVRPTISLVQFVLDNWKIFTPIIGGLFGGFMWILKQYPVWLEMKKIILEQ